MNTLLFFKALRARFNVFALALGGTLLTALVLTVLMPRTYQATASLVVDARQDQQSLNNVLEVLSAPSERTAYLQTQVDIITSPTVARRVVEQLELDSDPALVEEYEEYKEDANVAIEDWIAATLLQKLDVETTQSSVIHLSYMARNAQDSARRANAFANAYMETMLELRVEPTRQAATWFDEQLTTLRADLEQAQARMTAFQQEHGIISVDESLDDKYARFEDLSAQLLRAQEQAIEGEVLSGSARRVIETGGDIDDLPELLSNEYLRELDAAVLDGAARLDALATDLGQNHPEYRRMLAENAARRTERDAAAQKVLASADLRADQAWHRIAEIEKLLASQREELLDLKSDRDTLTVLQQDVETAQRAYDTARQRYVESQVESRASQTNVAILSAAVAPSRPHRPNLLLNLVLALGIGSMLGGGLVALAEMSDRRIRSSMDLREVSAMPMLGELTVWSPSRPALLPQLGDNDDKR